MGMLAKSRSQGRVGIVRPRPRVRVVNGYLRPKAPLLGYIRPALANRIYDVAYPYGVGGDTLLDRVAVDFDPWLTTAVIGYFFQRADSWLVRLEFPQSRISSARP